MGGNSSFLAILAIAGFLFATWTATKVSKAIGVSSIVLEIIVGVALGPRGIIPREGGLIPEEYSRCQAKRHIICEAPADLSRRIMLKQPIGEGLGMIAEMGDTYCPKKDYNIIYADGTTSGYKKGEGSRRLAGVIEYDTYEECLVKSCETEIRNGCSETPDFFTLVGHTGVAMMIFESGMHFDFDQARKVGPSACAVAILGTFLPLLTGAALTVGLIGRPLVPDGLAVGTSLAPTSIGIALRLLTEAGVLKQYFGQAIITAAFVDDILSLVLFNILFSLKGDFDVIKVVVYPIVGITFMAIAMAAAVKFWPTVINDKILAAVPPKADPNAKVPRSDEVLFLLMMGMLVCSGTITHFLGTHLWGCFIAGMSFACLTPPHHAHHVWVKQTKRATGWMIRIFFACTVAFSIPVDQLMSISAFWKGSLMGIGPCVLTKVLCAPFMGPPRWIIGWAMVGRAEFAYLIAQMAFAGDMINEETFSIVIWALLYATILAPAVFRTLLNRYIASRELDPTSPEKGSETDLKDAHEVGGMASSGI
jgi:Kef-type K+ transport system membrane component KefB